MHAIDQVQLSFNPQSLALINWMLAIIMFGVALGIRPADFSRVLQVPAAAMVGLSCQFLLMPALASLLVWWIAPVPSIALGILLVSACPGGNLSNFLTSVAGGNAALSVSLSALSTLASIFMTPLNFLFWANLNPHTRTLLADISLSPIDILATVLTILVLPTIAGMLLCRWQPQLAYRLLRPMRWLSLLLLTGFIGGALYVNFDHFLAHVGSAFWVVFSVNACGLLLGYGLARALQVRIKEAKAISFETGIQNSGFGLVLVFQFFAGLGGMAVVAAWWGVWHLVSGIALALFWARERQ